MAKKEVQLKAIVSVVDRLSPGLSKTQKSIAGFQKNIKSLERAAGNAGRAFSGLTKAALAPAAILGGALGYSLTSAVKNFAGVADALGSVSAKSGVAVDKLQELRYAASVNGASAEAMDAALVKLNKTLYDAANGKNADAAAMFTRLGISLKNADGSLRSAGDILPKLANGLKNNTNEALRTRMAMTAFGESGTQLLPLLTQGEAGLNAMSKRARELGLVVSDDAVKAGGDFNNTMAEISLSLQAATGEIVRGLLPVVTEVADVFMKWLAGNRELIATNVASWVQTISNAIRSVDWDVVKWFVGAFAGGALAGKLYELGKSLFVVGKAFYAAFGPVGLVIGGVATAIGLIYDNWDTIKKAWEEFEAPVWMKGLGAWFDHIADNFKALVDLVNSFKMPSWMQSIGDFFTGKSAEKTLATPNAPAVAMSATGAVHGSVDVNVNNVQTGERTKQTAPLTGAIGVSGDAGVIW